VRNVRSGAAIMRNCFVFSALLNRTACRRYPKIWRHACIKKCVRIAAEKSVNLNSAPVSPANIATTKSGFVALLASTAARTEGSWTRRDVPLAQRQPDSDRGVASAPEAAPLGANAIPENAAHQATPRIDVTAVLEQPPPSPVHCDSRNTSRSNGREEQRRAHRNATAIPVMACEELIPTQVWTALSAPLSRREPAPEAGGGLESQSLKLAEGTVAARQLAKADPLSPLTLSAGALKGEASLSDAPQSILAPAAANGPGAIVAVWPTNGGSQLPELIGRTTSSGTASQRDGGKTPEPPARDSTSNSRAAGQPVASLSKSGPEIPNPASSSLPLTQKANSQDKAFAIGTFVEASSSEITNVISLPDGYSQSLASGAGAIKDIGSVTAKSDGRNEQGETTAKTPDSPAHNSTSSNRAPQQPDSGSSKPAPEAVRSPSSGSTPIQATALQGAAHPIEISVKSSESVPQPLRSASQMPEGHAPAAAEASVVNTASLIQKVNESELRLAMHSSDFGAISIRTSLSPQQVLTQITVDHDGLGNALSAHVPAMQAKLGNELGIRTVVQVNENGSAFSGGGNNSPQSGQQGFQAAPAQNAIPKASAESVVQGTHLAGTGASDRRLDIRV